MAHHTQNHARGGQPYLYSVWKLNNCNGGPLPVLMTYSTQQLDMLQFRTEQTIKDITATCVSSSSLSGTPAFKTGMPATTSVSVINVWAADQRKKREHFEQDDQF